MKQARNIKQVLNSLPCLLITIIIILLCSIRNLGVLAQDGQRQETMAVSQTPSNIFSFFEFFYSPSSESTISGSRTFGKIRRLQMALIPLIFKFGVLSTLIFALVFLSLKTIFLVKTLLIVNLGVLLAKVLTWKTDNHHHHGSSNWVPQTQQWSPQLQKEVHVHIHNDRGHENIPHHSLEPYGAYSTNQFIMEPPNYPSVSRHSKSFYTYPIKKNSLRI